MGSISPDHQGGPKFRHHQSIPLGTLSACQFDLPSPLFHLPKQRYQEAPPGKLAPAYLPSSAWHPTDFDSSLQGLRLTSSIEASILTATGPLLVILGVR